MGATPEETYDNVKKYLREVIDQVSKEKINVNLRPEVMGKVSQFGTLEELLNLSAETNGVSPCIDFAHWRARTGKNNTYEEFCGVLAKIEKRLGKKRVGKHAYSCGRGGFRE